MASAGGEAAKPDFLMISFIKTTQDALWEALTSAEHIAKYNFAAMNARQRPDGGHDVLRRDGSVMLSQSLVLADPKSRLVLMIAWKA